MEAGGPFLCDGNESDNCMSCFFFTNNTPYHSIGNNSSNNTNAFIDTALKRQSCDDITTFRSLFLSTLALFGIVGNVLSLIVLQFRYKSSTANLYLKALAIADTLFLLSALVGSALDHFIPLYGPFPVAVIKLVVTFILGDISQFVSVWLTVALSFSRFMAVGKPFHANIYLCYRTTKRSISLIVLVSILLEAIKAGLLVQCESHTSDNGTYTCWVSMIPMWTVYIQVAHFTGSMFILPSIPLLVFNIGLLRVLLKMNENQPENIPGHRREYKEITKTVIWIVVVFLVSYAPYLAWGLLCVVPAFWNYMITHKCIARIVSAAFAISYHINSSVNFLIYLFCKPSFQVKLKSLCFKTTLPKPSSIRHTRYTFVATQRLSRSIKS